MLPLDVIEPRLSAGLVYSARAPSYAAPVVVPKPLAAARAVIFAQMVDDPSSRPELFSAEEAYRTGTPPTLRYCRRLGDLVKWESTSDKSVIEAARDEIRPSWRLTCADHADDPQAAAIFDPERGPACHDSFAGGGALPFEAQRLGPGSRWRFEPGCRIYQQGND